MLNWFKLVYGPFGQRNMHRTLDNWSVAELLCLSLNNWGPNFLQNEFSCSSQIYLSPEKLRQMFTSFWSIKLTIWGHWEDSFCRKLGLSERKVFQKYVKFIYQRTQFDQWPYFKDYVSLRQITWFNNQEKVVEQHAEDLRAYCPKIYTVTETYIIQGIPIVTLYSYLSIIYRVDKRYLEKDSS